MRLYGGRLTIHLQLRKQCPPHKPEFSGFRARAAAICSDVWELFRAREMRRETSQCCGGSIPLFLIAAVAAPDERNAINRLAASGSLEPTTTAAAYTLTF